MNEKSYTPFVSIIIPVYNSAGTLSKCVESITKQTYSNWEIIIVDSNSTDGTREIAIQWCNRLKGRCRYYKINKRFQAAKWNYGVRVCKGDKIFTFESDAYLTPRVLQECVRKVNEGYGGVEIFMDEIWRNKGYLAKCRYYLLYDIPGIRKESIYVNFVNRELYQKIGGHDESISYVEDMDFFLKFKSEELKIAPVEEPILHDSNVSFRWLIYKSLYHSLGLKRMRKKSKNNLNLKSFSHKGMLKRTLQFVVKHPSYGLGIIFLIFLSLTVRGVVKLLS